MVISVKKYSSNLFTLYASFLTVLWVFVNYGSGGEDPYTASDYRWYLISFGMLAFLFAMTPVIKPTKLSKTQIFLLIYIFIVSISSASRLDLKHFYEAVKLALPLWFLFQTKVSINVRTLNILFLIVLVGGIVTYSPSSSNFGFLPGQTQVNLHQGLWWRVSIWTYKSPPYSAAISILVFFVNVALNKSLTKYIYCILAMYFIVLSGSRTAYLIFLTGSMLFVLKDVVQFKYRKTYIALPIVMFLFIFLLQVFSELVLFLDIKNELLSSMLLRNTNVSADASNLSSRLLIMAEHFSLLMNSTDFPVLGIGSHILSSPQWTANGGSLGGSADSYISHILVRDGIAFFMLCAVFIDQFILSMKEKDWLRYSILTFLMLYCVGYGAWLSFTSPVFVLYCGCLYSARNIIYYNR